MSSFGFGAEVARTPTGDLPEVTLAIALPILPADQTALRVSRTKFSQNSVCAQPKPLQGLMALAPGLHFALRCRHFSYRMATHFPLDIIMRKWLFVKFFPALSLWPILVGDRRFSQTGFRHIPREAGRMFFEEVGVRCAAEGAEHLRRAGEPVQVPQARHVGHRALRPTRMRRCEVRRNLLPSGLP